MTKKQKEIIKKVNEVLESIVGSSLILEKEGKREVPTYDGEICIYDNIVFSFEWRSDLGEDIHYNVVFPKDFEINDVWKVFDRIYYDFDVDKHVESLIGMRGTNGVPSSIRALVEDAEMIENTYKKITNAINKLI